MDGVKLRGVNLGGWMVLERWMTPALFEGTDAKDEYSLMKARGGPEKLQHHRVTFITEEDFAWLAEHGVNAVRIPVGYWIFDGDGPLLPCIEYLDFAMQMAEKYRIKVLIDLHGAKGSQNGNDHSGRIGRAEWFENALYRQETIEVLVRLAERYNDSPAFWGIELLNEPRIGPLRFFILREFYRRAYQRLSEVIRLDVHIVFSDGFVPWLFSGVIRAYDEHPAAMDIHWYQFGRALLPLYFANLARRPGRIKVFERRQPVIIGEWSGMISHLTLRGKSKKEVEILEKEHIARQLEAYSGTGWFYWSYKTSAPGIWNFRSLVEQGKLLLK